MTAEDLAANTARPPRLERDRPHVWLFDMTMSAFDRLADIGAPPQHIVERADKLTDPFAARSLVARHGALRLVLAGYRGCAPEEVRVVVAPGGKPILVPGDDTSAMPLAFSVCHARDLYCVAVGRVSSLGVDLEAPRDVPRAESIAAKWFSTSEAAAVAGEAPEARTAAFLRLWTGKEALAKRHGAGLRLMGAGGHELDVDRAVSAGRLRFFRVGVEGPHPGQYQGAVASSEVIDGVEPLRWGGASN